MKRKIRVAGMLALVAGTALLATGCSGSGDSSSADGTVTMTFWHNSTTGPGKAYWEKTVADFEAANPKVKIKIQAIQNEDNDKEEEEWAARLRVGGAALSRLRASLAWSLLQILLNNPT